MLGIVSAAEDDSWKDPELRYDFLMDPLRAPDPLERIMGIYDHPDIVVDIDPARMTAVETEIDPAALETEVHQPDDVKMAPNVSNNSHSSTLNTDKAADLAVYPTKPAKRRRKITPQAEPISNMRSRQHYTNPVDQSDKELG
jgi:hypothetical protein